jgi:hypothetical protein
MDIVGIVMDLAMGMATVALDPIALATRVVALLDGRTHSDTGILLELVSMVVLRVGLDTRLVVSSTVKTQSSSTDESNTHAFA